MERKVEEKSKKVRLLIAKLAESETWCRQLDESRKTNTRTISRLLEETQQLRASNESYCIGARETIQIPAK